MNIYRNGLLICLLVCIASLWACGENSGSPDGDGESEDIIGDECLEDRDCSPGYICEKGYCINSGQADGDRENGDLLDGEALMVLSEVPVDFGAPVIFRRTLRTLQIASVGEGTLQIDSIELDGSTSDEYSLLNVPDGTIYLNPGESFDLTIAYTPIDPGVENGLLKIYSNTENSPVTSVELKAHYKGTPDIESESDKIDFGVAQVNGITASACVKVSNIPAEEEDNVVIKISNIKLTSTDTQTFELAPETRSALPIILAPKGEKELCVLFHPKSEGEFEGLLTVYNDDPDRDEQEFPIALIGIGAVPRLEVSPESIEFGDTRLNAAANLPVVFKNIGGWPLRISSAYMKPGSSADFTVDLLGNLPSGGVDVQPEASIQIMLRYAPLSVGADSGYLMVISTDPASGQTQVAVNGNGVYSTISSNPISLIFPATPLWDTSRITLRVHNDGNGEVNIDGVSFSSSINNIVKLLDADEVLPAVICAGTIHEGCVEELALTFEFDPAAETHYSGSVDILTGDENARLNVLASGSGVLPHAVFNPALNTTIDFGNVRIGESVTRSVNIANNGGYNLVIEEITIGDDARDGLDFCTINPADGTLTVQPGANADISISCTPSNGGETGQSEAVLSFASNDPDFEQVEFDLALNVIDPVIEVTPSANQHDFGEILIGLSGIPVQYTIRNTGVGKLVVTGIELASGSSNSFAVEGIASDRDDRLNVELNPFISSGDSLRFTVAYRPLTEADHVGRIQIKSNDFDLLTYEINLSGKGVGCAPNSHLCGSQCVDSSNVAHCGNNCNPCFDPPNGYPVCNAVSGGWGCGFQCDDGYAPKGDSCAPLKECCGSGCTDCTMLNPPHSTPVCEDGVCDFVCDFNYHEEGSLCVLNAAPVCCGESCINCTLQAAPHQDAYCVNEQCAFYCSEGYDDCNAQPGCETEIKNNLLNCGACNYICNDNAAPNMSATACSNYQCQYACNNGYGDCSSTQAGCETNINQNINNCGACNYVCSQHNPVHAHPTACTNGVCQFGCDSGYSDCIGSDGNCETATGSDVYNCGACGYVCLLHKPANTSVKSCTLGECIYQCNSNYGDCTSADGCETYLLTSTEHCRQCNYNCDDYKPLHARTKSCGAAGCVYECISPWADCIGSDGACESDLNNDILNCGACNKNCNNLTPSNMRATGCTSGVCQFACNDGYGDCNSIAGCETSTSNNPSHCGACNYVCSQQAPPNTTTTGCLNGQCQYACATNYLDCTTDAGCETYKLTNISHCGACNYSCADNAPPHMYATGCSSGVCQYACESGWSDCLTGPSYPGCETPSGTDMNNCGSCGYVCANYQPPNAFAASCNAGNCIFNCNPGFGDCTSSPGCETNVYVDLSNCGNCNNACSAAIPPNMQVAGCNQGVCEYTCQSGYKDCTAAPGCETNSNDDVNNCGACGNKCSDNAPPHMHASGCSSGSCQYECDTGYRDCTPSPGCETYIYSDMNNCGACNYSCSANTPYQSSPTGCSNYTCNYVCNNKYGDCTSANGCETDLSLVQNSCEAATTMYRNTGADYIRGDDGADVTYKYSGYGTKWFKVKVTDENSGLSPDYISVRFHLEVPPGVDYDLEIRDGCDTLVGYAESGTSGQDEIIDVTWSDTPIWDDDRTIYVKIYLYSGNNCSSWSLTASGNVHR